MTTKARREREKEERRQSILRAAREVFFENGFHQATVEAVAERAEVSKGTVYLYFESKETILAHLLLEGLRELVDELELEDELEDELELDELELELELVDELLLEDELDDELELDELLLELVDELDELDELKEATTGSPRALYLRGEALRELERYPEALKPLRKAAKVDPEDIHKLGVILFVEAADC